MKSPPCKARMTEWLPASGKVRVSRKDWWRRECAFLGTSNGWGLCLQPSCSSVGPDRHIPHNSRAVMLRVQLVKFTRYRDFWDRFALCLRAQQNIISKPSVVALPCISDMSRSCAQLHFCCFLPIEEPVPNPVWIVQAPCRSQDRVFLCPARTLTPCVLGRGVCRGKAGRDQSTTCCPSAKLPPCFS